ncbi:hypothetical protein BDN72DRAFT_841299 [Pluteus cervinus]|uniref:Uncharacterized protein n=1 Tax=Pluteus cervinus TaxID=181527 RepID=A0ACD3ASX8_9AGAR|nr:hypothetical protein BDN72DRAFT_841299 [Pluteus cervinus]
MARLASSAIMCAPESQDTLLLTLPIEVMTPIFNSIVQAATASSSYHSADLKSPPWTLSYVCSYWRRIILSLPIYWSHISLQMGFRFIANRHDIHLVALALERAKDHPLDVRLIDHTEKGIVLGHEAISQILARSNQWKTFEYTTTFVDLGPLEALHNQFPLLESITLEADHYHLEALKSSAFAVAPCLKRAKIGLSSLQVDLPFDQLESYEAGGTTFAVTDLRKCPRLQTYTGPPYLDFLLHPNLAVVRHTRLTRLQVGSSVELTWLLLPSLRHLVIYYPRRLGEDVFLECANFVRNSDCVLDHFEVNSLNNVNRAHMEEFLGLAPQLRTLRLTLKDIKPEVIEATLGPLTLPSHSSFTTLDDNPTTSLVPRLQNLKLHFSQSPALFGNFDHGPLVALLQSRYYVDSGEDETNRGTASPLCEVKIITRETARSSEISEYWELMLEGMNLSIVELDEMNKPVRSNFLPGLVGT